ncbi:hypothetical protein MK489_23760 [Myxococcota bacterium]|nr:hypothetical protein [Myxococcota bacterium]
MNPDTSLFSRLGVSARRRPEGPVFLDPFPSICSNGAVRASVLVLMVDMMAGFIAEARSEGDWVFTTDLSLRSPTQRIPERLECEGELLRAGRGSVICGVRILENGRDFAYGEAGFVRLARRHGDPAKPHLHDDSGLAPVENIERPLMEEVGIEVVSAAAGKVQVALGDRLRNPAGAMQGAIVSLVAERAAECLAEHDRGGPQRVRDVDIRYLAMGRVGPIHSITHWIGGPSTGSLRVELRDAGNDDRPIAAVLASVESVRD